MALVPGTYGGYSTTTGFTPATMAASKGAGLATGGSTLGDAAGAAGTATKGASAMPYINMGMSGLSLADALSKAGKKSTPFKDKVKKLKKDDPDTYFANKESLDKLGKQKQKGSGLLGAAGPALGLAGAIAATAMTGGAAAPLIPVVAGATAAGSTGLDMLASKKAKGEATMLGDQANQTISGLQGPQRMQRQGQQPGMGQPQQPRLAQMAGQQGGMPGVGRMSGSGGAFGRMGGMAQPVAPRVGASMQQPGGAPGMQPPGVPGVQAPGGMPGQALNQPRVGAQSVRAPNTGAGPAPGGGQSGNQIPTPLKKKSQGEFLNLFNEGLPASWMSQQANALTSASQDTQGQIDSSFARSGDNSGFNMGMKGGLQNQLNQQISQIPFQYDQAKRDYMQQLIQLYRSTKKGGGGYQTPQQAGGTDWGTAISGLGTAAKAGADIYTAYKG